MKKVVFTVLSAFFVLQMWAQESQTAFNFLRLPASAHVAALGGDNITLQEDDASLLFHNPSLLNNVSDRTLNLDMMTTWRVRSRPVPPICGLRASVARGV